MLLKSVNNTMFHLELIIDVLLPYNLYKNVLMKHQSMQVGNLFSIICKQNSLLIMQRIFQ